MIGLIQNKTIYEYDIRSLILAFMLGEKIELTDHVDSIYDFILEVQYKDQEIDMKLYKKGELEDEIQLFGDYEDKKLFKNQLKRGIYQLFSKALNKQLPWGTLTGIRPTKIAFDGYKKGESKSLYRNCTKREKTFKNISIQRRIQFICRNTILPKYMSVLFIYIVFDRSVREYCTGLLRCII